MVTWVTIDSVNAAQFCSRSLVNFPFALPRIAIAPAEILSRKNYFSLDSWLNLRYT
jgi:hypothetical protein